MQDELSFEGRVKEILKQSCAASNGGGDTACAIAKLKDLSAYPVTVLHLSQTGAGAQLVKLSHRPSRQRVARGSKSYCLGMAEHHINRPAG